jgi:hypothetical protein
VGGLRFHFSIRVVITAHIKELLQGFFQLLSIFITILHSRSNEVASGYNCGHDGPPHDMDPDGGSIYFLPHKYLLKGEANVGIWDF